MGEFACLRSFFIAWVTQAQHAGDNARLLHEERQRWEAYIAGDSIRWQEELRQRERLGHQRRQFAHNSIDLMVRKWMVGCIQGLLKELLSHWAKLSTRAALMRRQQQAVHCTVLKWVEGDRCGLLQACHSGWKAAAVRARLVTASEDLLDAQEAFRKYIGEQKALATRQQARSRATIDQALCIWEHGEATGLCQNA